MDEFGRGNQLRHILDLFLEPVFHRFDVMVGDGFDGLDAFGIGFAEFACHLVEQGTGCGRKWLDFGKSRLRQGL